MRSIYICIFGLLAVSVNANELLFPNRPNMPIRKVITDEGEGGVERIKSLYAEIYPRHLTINGRVNFPTSGDIDVWFQKIKTEKDERGHLVASQFSGPPEWYNLSPQNPRVNRNEGYQSILTDWFSTEREARNFLEEKDKDKKYKNRYVKWSVELIYDGRSVRPEKYKIRVTKVDNDAGTSNSIDACIDNPMSMEDSTFWICRSCRSNRHNEHELCGRLD